MSIIEDLIEKVYAQQREASEATQRAFQAQVAKMQAVADYALKIAMGPAWDELQPFVSQVSNKIENYILSNRYEVDAQARKLAKFSCNVSVSTPKVGEDKFPTRIVFKVWDSSFDMLNHPFEDVLLSARKQFLWGLNVEADRTGTRLAALTFEQRVEVEALYARLCEIAPERRAEWDAIYELKMGEIAIWGIEEAQHQAKKDAYRAAFVDYLERYSAVTEERKRILEQVQQDLDKPFRYWKLQFGITVDLDGERVTDTGEAYVLDGKPDEHGWWPVAHGGTVERTWFQHLVSVSGPYEARPTDKVYFVCRPIYFSDGTTIYIRCGDAEPKVDLPAYPEQPESDLSEWERDSIKSSIPSGDDGVPF